MQKDNLKSYIKLHLIVFIWGFTALLGSLITIQSVALVWYRMLLASVFLLLFIIFKKVPYRVSLKEFYKLLFVGLLIALHWIFFFEAIHISNVSITLSVFSLGAFITAILEPIIFKRKILGYEVIFGLAIVAALAMILKVEINQLSGVVYALISIILGVLFTLLNGKLIEKHDPSVISFYEFLAGVFFITIYFLITQKFSNNFFVLTMKDWMYLLILSSICTAYAFSESVKVMRRLSPYTVLLTTSLEPVYGILLAFYIIGGKEKMSFDFYIGAILIVFIVLLNGLVKHYYYNKK